MGKHGKSNATHHQEQTIRKKKKEEKAKNIMNFRSNGAVNIGKQGGDLPRLKMHKTMLLNDLEKKQKNITSKEQMVQALKNKLEHEDTNNRKITMAHLIESANQSKELTASNQVNQLINQVNYFNRDQTSDFFDSIGGNKENTDFSRKLFIKDLKQVIEASDVILEVVDARDPLTYRSKELENQILSYPEEKKIIIIVNKIDLVSTENAQAWKDYLKKEFPCVLFKANTQNQNSNLSNTTIFHSSFASQKDFIEDMINSNKAIGGEDLMNILKNYCRSEDKMKSITVGIVGFPNVGKSSIINSLKRGKAVGVSSTPGFTKAISEVILDKNVKLLDCPGVVYSNNSEANLLTNILRPESIDDPVNVVRLILSKVQRDEIIKVYELEKEIDSNPAAKSLIYELFINSELNISHVEKFLCFLGMKLGKFKKGGIVDIQSTGVSVIQDWNKGKIKYMSQVPNTYINCNYMNEDS